MNTTNTILTLDKLTEIVPYSRSQIARLEKAGDFPKRIRLSPRRVGWIASEIEEWVNERSEARFENPK